MIIKQKIYKEDYQKLTEDFFEKEVSYETAIQAVKKYRQVEYLHKIFEDSMF